MSVQPIITFKAGQCEADFDVSPPRIKPAEAPGLLYLYNEDDLIHLCWRERGASLANPGLDLHMIPQDARFLPYFGKDKTESKSPVNGRIFVLKFSSSQQRYFFWLQSREQPKGDPTVFSQRDLRLGQIVDNLLQGDEVGANTEIENLLNQRPGTGGDDGDAMEDLQEGGADFEATGGAGANATGGDVREEGEEAREGGANGGRAVQGLSDQTQEAVRNFLASLQGKQQGQQRQTLFTTLSELLPASTSIQYIESAPISVIEELLAKYLPADLVYLEHQVDEIPEGEQDPDVVMAMVQALDDNQKRGILRRVLHSPQFTQSLMSLTHALRDGGLPMVSEALRVEIRNGGYTGPDRRVPLTGGDAVEAFLEGIRKAVDKSANKASS